MSYPGKETVQAWTSATLAENYEPAGPNLWRAREKPPKVDWDKFNKQNPWPWWREVLYQLGRVWRRRKETVPGGEEK